MRSEMAKGIRLLHHKRRLEYLRHLRRWRSSLRALGFDGDAAQIVVGAWQRTRREGRGS